jgi:hypothetical protein
LEGTRREADSDLEFSLPYKHHHQLHVHYLLFHRPREPRHGVHEQHIEQETTVRFLPEHSRVFDSERALPLRADKKATGGESPPFAAGCPLPVKRHFVLARWRRKNFVPAANLFISSACNQVK